MAVAKKTTKKAAPKKAASQVATGLSPRPRLPVPDGAQAARGRNGPAALHVGVLRDAACTAAP